MSENSSDKAGSTDAAKPLVRVRNLTKHYPITKGILDREVGRVRAVDGISFDVHRGETFGLVGESGCGKSTTATTLTRLEEPTAGQIYVDGSEITEYDETQLTKFRRTVQMIFQDPTSSFDPRMTIGESVTEPLEIQGIRDSKRRREIATDLLERVGIAPEDYDRYPHEFSGGEKQRIALARALSVNPDVLVADEPVSALDVSIQSEILRLIADLQSAFGLTIIVISHDLGVIKQICDRIAVMYLGEIVEIGDAAEIFADPTHPYTQALLGSIPTPDPSRRGMGVELEGDVPSPSNPPPGCRFHTRCPEVIQPAGISLPQAEWRQVQTLRQRVRDGTLSMDGIRATLVAEEPEIDPPVATGSERLKAQVRREFDIPESLSTPESDETLEAGLEAIVAGDHEEAMDRLNDVFTTPCERVEPSLRDIGSAHSVACLLHQNGDGETTGGPGAPTAVDYTGKSQKTEVGDSDVNADDVISNTTAVHDYSREV